MISQDKEFIFIHIPKTAGTSIYSALGGDRKEDNLFGYNKKLDLYLQHLTAEEMLKYQFVTEPEFRNYFKFCFVRNPWDRVVSEWLWRTKNVPRHNLHRYVRLSLKHFIEKVPTWRGKVGSRIRRHLLPQHQFIYDAQGQPMVDYVGRFENLRQDFDTICQQIGLDGAELPWSNSTRVKISYRDYYDDETYEMVKDLYAEDIDYFDYQF